ncbi:MAG: tetratricopeptide repeat protein [Cyanobacteria bacterium P01_G01_bin.39]
MNTPPEFALSRYKASLKYLKKRSISEASAIEILSSREALELSLSNHNSIEPEIQQSITELDCNLIKQAYRLNAVVNLRDWRIKSANQTADWIWNLETKGAKHPLNQYQWLFKGFRLIAWVVILAIFKDIYPRFINGGLSVLASWEIVVPSLFTLFTAGSELTESSKTGWSSLIGKWKFNQNYQEISILAIVLMLLIFAIAFRAYLPTLSQSRNQQGFENYNSGKVVAAEESFLKALAFNPDNYDAHYNLGNLYEYLQKFDDAEKQYLIAMKGDFPQAYNNLARLRIGNQEYAQAVALLQKGINKTRTEENFHLEDKYSLFKNLGWARFEQKQFKEAEQSLKTAINIAKHPEASSYIENPGSAHCLMAQALEKQEKSAITEWEQCLQKAKSTIPEEDSWLHLARTKLQEAK